MTTLLGDRPTYVTVHMRLRRWRGPAKTYECKCGTTASDWAYMGSSEELVSDRGWRYSANPADYSPMCKPCHRSFDRAHVTHCPHGHEYAGANLLIENRSRTCKTCKYARNAARPIRPEQKAQRAKSQRLRRTREREARLLDPPKEKPVSQLGKTILRGHALRDEGKAHYTDEGTYRWKAGRAKCECGLLSEHGISQSAAQKWHREHKDEVRRATPAP